MHARDKDRKQKRISSWQKLPTFDRKGVIPQKGKAERKKDDIPATHVSAFWLYQACNSIYMKGGSKINWHTHGETYTYPTELSSF